jgi:hypothetical protein
MKNLNIAFCVLSLALSLTLISTGCGKILGGNVYSDGYRDGYIVGVSSKRQGFGGISYVGEIKVSFYGFGGGAVDPSKSGQLTTGSWSANFFDKTIAERCAVIRGDQLVRIHYTEKDIQFNGGTNYEVTKIELLPPAGELVPIVSAVK